MRINDRCVLWSSSFTRIYLANFFMFISQYMLLPVLPLMMSERLGLPLASTGNMCPVLMGSMLIIGPFYNYWIDVYRRKYMYMLAFAVMIFAAFAYGIINNEAELWMLCIVHGVAFGMASVAGITLAIDLTVSARRSEGNVVYGWAARLGMFTGMAIGPILYLYHDFEAVIYGSAIVAAAGLFAILTVHVPFRAPIGVKVCSFDRFFLPRGWLLMMNLILIAFVPGLLFPLVYNSYYLTIAAEISVSYFVLTAIGFLLSLWLAKLLRINDGIFVRIVIGLILIITGESLLLLPVTETALSFSFLFLGIGLGFVAPKFLMMFIMLSKHCQRGTGNITHLLGWEVGVLPGIATACYLTDREMTELVPVAGVLSSILALILFVSATYPYVKRNKVR